MLIGNIMLKKLIIIGFSFLLLSNLHLNKEEVKTMDTTIDNDTLVLHFADDDRMPFHLYSDWLVGSSFTKGIYGTITHLTPNGLFITDHEDSILDFIEREEGEPATKFILKIKEGLYFEKAGKKIEFTASDLKFSYAIPFFLKKPDIFEKSALKIIKGMDKIIPGETYSDDKITGITILDKYTVKIELNHLDSHVITNLSSSRYPIVSKEFYLEKLKNSSEELTPGLGKYETLSINKLTGETLLKRKKAVAGFPTYIKYISNKDLQQGDILWSSANIWENKVPKHYQKQVDSIPAETAGIFFNFKTVLGNDPKFRKAISIAINRDKITKNSDFLIPNAQILPNGYWGRIETEDKYNIEQDFVNFFSVKLMGKEFILGTFKNGIFNIFFLISIKVNPKANPFIKLYFVVGAVRAK